MYRYFQCLKVTFSILVFFFEKYNYCNLVTIGGSLHVFAWVKIDHFLMYYNCNLYSIGGSQHVFSWVKVDHFQMFYNFNLYAISGSQHVMAWFKLTSLKCIIIVIWFQSVVLSWFSLGLELIIGGFYCVLTWVQVDDWNILIIAVIWLQLVVLCLG